MTLPDPTPGSAVAVTPTAPDRDRLAHPIRQSPIALVFIAWRFIRRIGIVNIGAALVFTVTGGFSALLWAAASLAAVALLVFSTLSWWRFTFVVVADELVVTSGVLSVERLVIPLDRVQSVSIDQKLLHRVVGLVSASVDTAGSSGAEFEIAAIDAATAEALRLVTADARSTATDSDDPMEAAAPVAPDEVLVRRTAGELALVGATRLPWAGLAVLAPLIAVGDEVGGRFGLGNRFERAVDGVVGTGDGSAGSIAFLLVGLVIVAAVFGSLLQLVREVVTNWDLTLHRTPTGLRRTAGLLSRTSRSSTVRRVQAITTDDTPPQRWLGFTSATLKTFGDNDMTLPGSRPHDVEQLRSIVFGRAEATPTDRPLTRWFVFLAVRNMLVGAALIGVALWFRLGWWSTLALVLVPIRWAVAERQWRRRRWGLADGHIAESYELITRHTAEAPLFKTQVVKVTQSFFERRRGLATVRIQTADGFLAVPLVDRDEAMAVRDRALYAVETDRRPAL